MCGVRHPLLQLRPLLRHTDRDSAEKCIIIVGQIRQRVENTLDLMGVAHQTDIALSFGDDLTELNASRMRGDDDSASGIVENILCVDDIEILCAE